MPEISTGHTHLTQQRVTKTRIGEVEDVMGFFDRRIGSHEMAAMERRAEELRRQPSISRWDARELDELEAEIRKHKPKSALQSYADGDYIGP